MNKRVFVTNIIILIIEVIAVIAIFFLKGRKAIVHYTVLSNIVQLFTSALMVFGMCKKKNEPIPSKLYLIRYLAACMLTLTFIVVLFYLGPQKGFIREFLKNANSVLHLLVPLLSLISFLFWEKDQQLQGKYLFLFPTVLTLIYGLFVLGLNITHFYTGPYSFFKVYEHPAWVIIVSMIVLLILVAVISEILKRLHNRFSA